MRPRYSLCERFKYYPREKHLVLRFLVRETLVSNSALGLLYGHGILTIYENLLLS